VNGFFSSFFTGALLLYYVRFPRDSENDTITRKMKYYTIVNNNSRYITITHEKYDARINFYGEGCTTIVSFF